MNTVHRPRRSRSTPSAEISRLRARLAETEEAIRAIRGSEVDTIVISGKKGPEVFTLHGAEHAYRVLIESMNEGALTLTPTKTILYANECFARMVRCPLKQVIGSSLRRFLSPRDRLMLRRLLQGADKAGAKIQVELHAIDGSPMPVQISIRSLAMDGFNRATIGMVVTDLTETRRSEEQLRALTHRIVRVQEAERGRIALELHDHITQVICALVFRSQALAENLSAGDGAAPKEALGLSLALGKVAQEVERISHNLRPGVLEHLGLVAVLRETSRDFEKRTGVLVKLACAPLTARLPASAELALYRILQEALKNVEKHARAQHVSVGLKRDRETVQLTIGDDGLGFAPEGRSLGRNGKGGLGLLGMSERAMYVGGTLTIKSVRRAGTEIIVRIPIPSTATVAL